MFRAKIYIRLKESILDPQGKAVTQALHNLGCREVKETRIGKFIELLLDVADRREAEKQAHHYCASLLANPVIETFRFDLEALQEPR